MSTPRPGRISSLEFDGAKVGGRVDMNLQLERGEIDASHMDSGAWSDFLKGRRSASISFSLRYIEGDAGQAKLIDEYFGSSDDPVDITFTQNATSGSETGVFECEGFVTSLDLSDADEAPQDMNGSIRITGPVTPVEEP